ncbi:hypothetical protein J437_LFUL015399 [Ladona fulva]|uniref:Uncharacterized protein n=1 Tax=Ladona fulva TaxID=123851 RepID=A0A8K0KNN9_LADFU|nr:hypothetical protein J437_LFUL015399 [Ladona fulva]
MCVNYLRNHLRGYLEYLLLFDQNMPKNINVQIFINASKQFLTNRNEKAAIIIQRQLQVLSEISDESIFDTSADGAGPEFYVTLHDLLSTVDPVSNIAHLASDVLANAIRNKNARTKLVNVYRFSWPIARIFLALPTSGVLAKGEGEKCSRTFKLLCLLRELTYGIRLLWQESLLPRLIRALLDIVSSYASKDSAASQEEANGAECEVADDSLAVSLAVLVNLCHQNLPALYCLLRAVDGREFMRILFRISKGTISLDANIQVSKMLVIMEGVSGGIPDASMQTFIHLTFTSMKEALIQGNTSLLRHVVDFFADVRGDGSSKPREALLNYTGYKEGVQSLLTAASDQCSSEEACYLLDFLQTLIEMGVDGIKSLHPSLASFAVHWIKNNGEASHYALSLLCTLISFVDDDYEDGDTEMLDTQDVREEADMDGDSSKRKRQSDGGTPLLKMKNRRSMLLLKPEKSVKSSEEKDLSSATVSVRTLVNQAIPDLLAMLEVGIKEAVEKLSAKGDMRSRLKSLFQLLSHILFLAKTSSLCQQMENAVDKGTYTSLFDPILGTEAFITEDLFQLDVVGLYTEALRFGAILAFRSAPWLTLCSRLLSQSQILSLLAMALLAGDWNLRQRVLSLVSAVSFPEESVAALAKSMNSLESLLMISDKGRVIRPKDEGLCENKEAISSNYARMLRGDSCPSIGYPQKLTEVFPLISREQESRLDSFISTLQAAKDRNKVSRLHQLLYYKQQCLEACQSEKQQLSQKLQNEELKAMEKHTQHMQDIRTKNREIETVLRKVDSLNKEMEEVKKEKEEIITKHDKLSADLEGANENIGKLEEAVKMKEKLLEDTQKEVDQQSKMIKELQEGNHSLKLVNKRNEQIILEREAKIKEATRELQELQRIREMIYEISAGKKKEM